MFRYYHETLKWQRTTTKLRSWRQSGSVSIQLLFFSDSYRAFEISFYTMSLKRQRIRRQERCCIHPSFQSCAAIIELITVFSVAWHEIAVQLFLVLHYQASHVFTYFLGIHTSLLMQLETASDSWDISLYITWKRYILSHIYQFSRSHNRCEYFTNYIGLLSLEGFFF